MEDLEAISRLRIESILETSPDAYSHQQLLRWSEVRTNEITAERILDRCVLVGTSGTRIVATIALDLDNGEMTGLFVCPAFQKLGLGQRMVVEIERLAISFGMDQLRIEAPMPSIGFFRSCKYEKQRGGSAHINARTRLDCLPMMRSFPQRQTRYGARIRRLCESSGIPLNYGRTHRLMLQAESRELATIGSDIYDREQLLQPEAGMAWYELRQAAENDGVTLFIASAFRSVGYQQSIISRKLEAGQSIDQILQVSAAPGYSEHHTGHAIDISCPDSKPLEESFENTLAFEWLTENAGEYHFSLSYPRNNRHGIAFEPWHWKFRP